MNLRAIFSVATFFVCFTRVFRNVMTLFFVPGTAPCSASSDQPPSQKS